MAVAIARSKKKSRGSRRCIELDWPVNEQAISNMNQAIAENAQQALEAGIREARAHGLKIALFEQDLRQIFQRCAGGNAQASNITSFDVDMQFSTFMCGADAAYQEQHFDRLPYAETCHVHVVRSSAFPDQAMIGSYLEEDIADLQKTMQLLNPTGSAHHELAPVVTSTVAFNQFGKALLVRGVQKLDVTKLETLQGYPNDVFPMRLYADVLDQIAKKPIGLGMK